MKRRVVDPGVPRLQKYEWRRWHNAPPLLGVEQHDDEDNSSNDEAVHIDEVPYPRNADGVPVARRAHERRDVTRIVLRGPESVAWNLQWRKPNPFTPRCAAIIEVETGVVHQDRKPATNQYHHKKKIEEVTVAHPYREAVWPRKVVWIYLRNSRNTRHPGYSDLDPSSYDYDEDRDAGPNQDRRSNPNAKATIRRIMNSSMRGVEPNHPSLHKLPLSLVR